MPIDVGIAKLDESQSMTADIIKDAIVVILSVVILILGSATTLLVFAISSRQT